MEKSIEPQMRQSLAQCVVLVDMDLILPNENVKKKGKKGI